MFLWRLARHSIPTEDVRHHRKMATSDACQLCGSEDSWRHLLLDCTMSRCVWELVDEELAEHAAECRQRGAKNWLFYMLDSLPHPKFVKVAVTLWAIWTARRKAVHEGIF